MGFIIIIPFAALFGWTIFAIYRWLRKGGYEDKWWRAFGILATAGLLLGVWLAFFSKYTVAKIHLEGFPIPIVIVSPNQPSDAASAMPLPIRIGGIVTDILSGVAFCLAPVAAAAFFKENKMKHPPGSPRAASPP